MIWFLAHPLPPHLPSVSSIGDTQEDWERETTCCGERGVGGSGRGAELYDHRKKAWPSINHSILSGFDDSPLSPIVIAVTDSSLYCIWFIVTPPWLVLGWSDTQWCYCLWRVDHLCHRLCQVDDMGWNENEKGGFFWIFSFFMYVIQHSFIGRPSDSTVSEDAGIEPRTVATLALTATL